MTKHRRDDDVATLRLVIALYGQGLTMREIGARLSPPRADRTIGRWLTQAGVSRRDRKLGTSASERLTRDRLDELYCRQGHSAQTIADHYGVTARTVLDRLRMFGLPIRPAGRPKMDGTRPPSIGAVRPRPRRGAPELSRDRTVTTSPEVGARPR